MQTAFPTGLKRRAVLMSAARRAKATGRKFVDDDAHWRAEEYLAESLGSLKGLPQKIGQILSLRSAPESSRPLSALSGHGVKSLPWYVFEECLDREIGRPMKDCFRHVSEIPLAAASLSQVHAAELPDGREVVVKVQYPGIEEIVREDLQSLGWLGAPFQGFQKRFRLDEYSKLIEETLHTELDYRAELAALKRFSKDREAFPWLRLPEAIEDLCSSKMLTLTRLKGVGFPVVCAAWNQSEKRLLAERLLTLFLDGLLGRRFLHADPHPGNYRFSGKGSDPHIYLFDFGCVKEVPLETARALTEMISAVRFGHEIAWNKAFERLGFEGSALMPIQGKLGEVARILFAPFASDKSFDLRTWQRAERIEALLGPDRWALRTAAPASFFFIMRAFHGITYYLSSLDAPINWARIAEPWVPCHAVGDSMAKVKDTSCPPDSSVAVSLGVLVEEEGEIKVRLYMPAKGALNLREQIPDHVLDRLPSHGIAIEEIEARLRSERVLKPGPIFEFREGPKRIRVWLE